MTRLLKILLISSTVLFFTSCEFIKNTFTYKDKTKEFVESIIKEDYDKCLKLFALEHEMAKNADKEEIKKGLVNFRELVVKNFGTNLDYSLMSSEKKYSSKKEESTPPNTTLAMIQFSNEKEFGVFKVLFDDKSGKILNINALDVKEPIPSMTFFWLFGLLALCVPIFNIYVIRQIKRSDLKKKWLKYLAILFFNVPAISYAAVKGLSFDLLNFQVFLGISFSYTGFLNSIWTFGIPLGGIYWFWKLKQNEEQQVVIQDKQEVANSSDI